MPKYIEMSGVGGAFYVGVKTFGMADINCEVDIFRARKMYSGGGVKKF